MLKIDWAARPELQEPDLRFIVTGATGWLGRATAEALLQALGPAFGERVTLCGSRQGVLMLSDGSEYPVTALDEVPAGRPGPSRYVLFHYAFLTKDRVAGLDRGLYVAQNRHISESVAAIMDRHNVWACLVASSGAVHHAMNGGEGDESLRVYGQLKLEDEARFSALCRAAHTRLVMPRLFNLSGPYINKCDQYALSAIIADVLAARPVNLHARKRVFRSYCDVEDVLALCLRLLFTDRFGTAGFPVFDTVGDETLEVGELSRRIITILDGPVKEVCRPALEPVPDDYYVGAPEPFNHLMATMGCVRTGLNEQIERTAHYMRSLVGSRESSCLGTSND